MTDRQNVKLSLEDRIAVLTIDHPPVNAFDRQTLQDLRDTVLECVDSPQVKAMVLTGAGLLAFIAGADINELALIRTEAEAHQMLEMGQETFNIIERSPKPVIAAINGFALGGGLECALACHYRIADDRARLGEPEIGLGIIPGWGGTQRLVRAVGASNATQMILTGDPIAAQEALRIGLVNKVVPGGEALKQAKGLAGKIATKGMPAIRACMQAISGGLNRNLEDGLALERELFISLLPTEDLREGLTAFLDKRQPAFKDR